MPLLKQITSRDIDWDGSCEFDGNGKVVKFIKPSSANHFRMLPIPKDDNTINEAKQADLILKGIMKSATKDQIGICIKRLSLHCGMQAKTPEEVKSLFLDYCNDLEIYPIKLIEDACAQYRTMPQGNSFMPSSGQLLTLIDPQYNKMRLLKKRIDKILGVYVRPLARENKTLSLSEALARL